MTDIANQVERAVAILAQAKIGVSLEAWGRLSNDILAGAAEIRRLRAENEGLKESLRNSDTALARIVCEDQ